MDEYRPDPDVLLAAVQKDESRQQRGKLKIYLGMAAGVGKTYAMLEAAARLRNEGLDVVVGYVETHGRAETEALLEGLEVIPRRRFQYRDTFMEELDTDAILTRSPQIVLVDELAHTNVPGARHTKRYQDIVELLESGIDVHTTVNVQHFESRADAVHQITGITVHETVPDSLLDLADEIELIDLSPDELRKRLAEGKVYTPERIEVAARNFFRVGNLTALREMALRLTAERVDHQLQDYMQLKRIAGPWKSGERLMVAVSPSPFSERLIRWTRRMAYNLEASWMAVHVETPEAQPQKTRETLASNLALARNLGAEVLTTSGEDVSSALLRLARQRNVTQIVVGKPLHSKLQEILRGGSLVNRLIRASGDIDIYVITGDEELFSSGSGRWFGTVMTHSSWMQYLLALGVVLAVAALDTLIAPYVSYQLVGLTELFAVLLIAVYAGRGPALLAAAVSAISWNFLFIEPRFTFNVSQAQDVVLLVLYFAIALFTGNLTARIRTQERLARNNADRTMALYALAHETATAVSMDDVLRTAVTQIDRVFDAEVAILLPRDGRLENQPHPASTLRVDEKDFGVATWVFENGRQAGRFTDTLPLASAQYLPFRTPTRIVGVLGISLRGSDRLSFEQTVLLETFISQIALGIEREILDEAAEQSTVLRESERLYTSLLNSISHELRTPISAITGAASSLLEPNVASSETSWQDLISDIQSAAAQLNRLVENLLDMSRLESGRLKLKREWCHIGELIGVAVSRLTKRLADRPLSIEVPPDLPLIELDFVLIEQVLVNLLDNVCSYTPAGTGIQISACQEDNQVLISVSDHGPGIPASDLERIFEKFYRAAGSASGGTGLGLSISRGLVECHGGTLIAENIPQGGARFTIRLPVRGAPPPVQEAKT